MINLNSSGIDPIADLLNLSSAIGDKVHSENSFCYTHIKEAFGKGTITAARISDTISTLIFDVCFNDEVELQFKGNGKNSIDFIYCLEGSLHHRFGNSNVYQQINFRQNSIFSRNIRSKSTFKFPSHAPLKISLISYKPKLKELVNSKESALREIALDILSNTYNKENFKYLGRVCFRTSTFVNDVMKFSFNSSADILFKEAAILNTLASQIDRHDKDTNGQYVGAPIQLFEIDRIIALENFINDNLSENLSIKRLQEISGLGPSKLQKGFQYLFEKSVTSYITHKRLQKAAILIQENNSNVSELVYSVGFSSRSYFSKIFKRHFGMMPSQCIANPKLLKVG